MINKTEALHNRSVLNGKMKRKPKSLSFATFLMIAFIGFSNSINAQSYPFDLPDTKEYEAVNLEKTFQYNKK